MDPPNFFDDKGHFVQVDFGQPKAESIIEMELEPVRRELQDFCLTGGDWRDPRTMDQNASLHLNGISSLYNEKAKGGRGALYIDFILSTGERSALPKPHVGSRIFKENFLRGSGEHVACSYSCHACIGVIEVYE